MEAGGRVGGTCLDPATLRDSRQIGARKCCNSVTSAFKMSRGGRTRPVGGSLKGHVLDSPVRDHIRIVMRRKGEAHRG